MTIKDVIIGLLCMGLVYVICFIIQKINSNSKKEFYLPEPTKQIPMPPCNPPKKDNDLFPKYLNSTVNEISTYENIILSNNPFTYSIDKINSKCIKVEKGLKIECSHEAFENIITEKYIQDNYTLNIIKLEDDRYSIYFDNKKDLFIKWC